MLLAFVRLFTITAVVIFSLVLAALGLRFLGDSQRYSDFQHPMKEHGFWHIFIIKDKSTRLPQGAFPGAKVQQLADQSLVVWPQNFVQHPDAARFLGQLNRDEWKTLAPQGFTLDEFLHEYANQPVLLEANLPHLRNAEAFRDKIRQARSDNNILIQTSSQSLKKSLKKLEPQWLYGATTAEIGKFRFTTALYLTGVVEAAFDFIIMPSYSDLQLKDLDARYIRALVSNSESSFDQVGLQGRSVDGVVTMHPVLSTE